VFVIACAAGVLLGSVYVATRTFPASWQQSLNTCDVAEIVPRLHRLIDMPPDGLRRVAQSLGSAREEVAHGAAVVLDEHLTRWEQLPPHIARRNVSVLAAEMAAGVARYSPAIQNEAAELAKRILRWPADPRSADRVQLVAYCDVVLQAAYPEPKPSRLTSYESAANRDLLAETRSASNMRTPEEYASLEIPGGGLPIDLHTAETGDDAANEMPVDRQTTPQAIDAGLGSRDPHEADPSSPRLLDSAAEQGLPQVEPQPHPDRHDMASSQPNRPGRLPVDAELLRKLWNEPQRLTSFELIRLAQTGDDATAQRAWKEIQTRDIPPKFLELGLHLTNPDPVVRRRWAERLPSLPGVDARPWLLALSDDEDAQVRMTALVLMATTADPGLLRRIEQLARGDREPQIQDQARRILAGQRDQRR